MFYVYQHRKADTNEIFYVGKGKGRRFNQLFGRNQYWNRVVNKHGFVTEIIAKDLDEELAFLVESETIDVYKKRGIKLVNATDGGEGASGYKHTEKYKNNLKGNSFGASAWGMSFKGKKHTEETKARMSYARIGNKNKLGKKVSQESKEKMSQAKLGKLNIKKRVLTEDQVKEIKSKIGYRNIEALARQYGVGASTIRRIRDGQAYKEVE